MDPLKFSTGEVITDKGKQMEIWWTNLGKNGMVKMSQVTMALTIGKKWHNVVKFSQIQTLNPNPKLKPPFQTSTPILNTQTHFKF